MFCDATCAEECQGESAGALKHQRKGLRQKTKKQQRVVWAWPYLPGALMWTSPCSIFWCSTHMCTDQILTSPQRQSSPGNTATSLPWTHRPVAQEYTRIDLQMSINPPRKIVPNKYPASVCLSDVWKGTVDAGWVSVSIWAVLNISSGNQWAYHFWVNESQCNVNIAGPPSKCFSIPASQCPTHTALRSVIYSTKFKAIELTANAPWHLLAAG